MRGGNKWEVVQDCGGKDGMIGDAICRSGVKSTDLLWNV